ncbi:YbaN family protein [Vibrio sp.]|nr:YbaN family protein [Vibrio sp.]
MTLRSKGIKLALMILGCLSLVLGVVGVFFPVLPTTPFVILAGACFLRSSPKMSHWLQNHSTFGPILLNWQKNKAIERPIKKKAIVMMTVSFSFSIYLVDPIWLKVFLFVLFLFLAIWLWRLPEGAQTKVAK